MATMRELGLGAVLALGATGCTVWADIKPTEVPKIGNVTVAPAVSQTTGRSDVIAVSIARVERTDGRILEVSGHTDVRVTCRGQERRYEYPITSTIEGETLHIASSNYAKTSCALADVSKAQVVDVPASNVRFWTWYGVTMVGLGVALPLAISSAVK